MNFPLRNGYLAGLAAIVVVGCSAPDDVTAVGPLPTSARSAPSGSVIPAPGSFASSAAQAAHFAQVEADVLIEINFARTRPGAYADLLQGRRGLFRGLVYHEPGAVPLRTQEGTAALDEAVAALRATAPMAPMVASAGLRRAARFHADDLGPGGLVSHESSDGTPFGPRLARFGRFRGSTAENISFGPATGREIVAQLLMDDGVPSRGHRTNLLQPRLREVGIAVGPHARYRVVCVMDFADAFDAMTR